ncbi:MAG: DASH family cryptochrome [Bacteroidia bacterium]|nr:DASH family cryptochrome [Bacteroidia bacterium]
MKTAILWYRNDLRLHDHEALTQALAKADEVLPVYCIDPRLFGKTEGGLPKTGAFRAQFLLQSLENLRKRLQSKGSNLLILTGKPEDELPALAHQVGVSWIFAHQEATDEEIRVENGVERALFRSGITLELIWGSTLYHKDDLPMPLQSLPDMFTQFRKQVEKFVEIRPTFPTPDHIPTAAITSWGKIPQLTELGLTKPTTDPRGVMTFEGGEEAGIERLQTYFWENNALKEYKETRNGLLGADYSSKFSAWLALGCLSPRYIYEQVKKYEDLRVANDSTYWLIFELIWRDYFRFVALKFGNSLFHPGGIKGERHRGKLDRDLFEKWKQGLTGVPFVDANMRELLLTGFMSNRGRQNVASYLVKDLGLDWRLGAEWFESQLLDYDPCSNWGNWNYVAGVGNDPRENRYFHVVSQSRRYDVKGTYLRTWLPELKDLPTEIIHEPWGADPNQLKKKGVVLGLSYPKPLISGLRTSPKNM